MGSLPSSRLLSGFVRCRRVSSRASRHVPPTALRQREARPRTLFPDEENGPVVTHSRQNWTPTALTPGRGSLKGAEKDALLESLRLLVKYSVVGTNRAACVDFLSSVFPLAGSLFLHHEHPHRLQCCPPRSTRSLGEGAFMSISGS